MLCWKARKDGAEGVGCGQEVDDEEVVAMAIDLGRGGDEKECSEAVELVERSCEIGETPRVEVGDDYVHVVGAAEDRS